jgi:DNA-binding transcriptional LysR family regulator
LPEDLAAFVAAHPNVRVDLQEHTSSVIAERVLEGKADVGVLVMTRPLPGLRVTMYRRERLAVIVSSRHRLATREVVSFDDLLDEDWVGLPDGTAISQLVKRQARSRGVELRMRIQVNGMDSACRMVQSGLGIGLMPRSAGDDQPIFPGVVTLLLRDGWAERTSVVVTSEATTPSPASQALVQALTSSARPPVYATEVVGEH